MKKNLVLIAILATLTLGGCASAPGVFNGLDADPMRKLSVTRTDGKRPTPEQYQAVVDVVLEMQAQLEPQISSSLESAASSAIPFGIVGTVGGAIEGGVGAGIGGAAGFLGGGISGLMTDAYARTWSIAGAAENAIRDRERRGEKIFENVHVDAAFVRTNNTRYAPAPGLLMLIPEK